MQNFLGAHCSTDSSPPPTFLTASEIAKRWRMCGDTVKSDIRGRDLESVRLGRRELMPISEIERLERL